MKLRILATAAILAPLWLATPAKAGNPEHIRQVLETKQCPNCDLSGADLKGANLQGANLSGANLRDADITNANLQGANISRADLTNANLTNANLNEANLTGTIGVSQLQASGEQVGEGRERNRQPSESVASGRQEVGQTGSSRSLGFRTPDIRESARREGGATRGTSVFQRGESPTALVPETNVGLTVAQYPTFFVYVPQTALRKAEFVLQDETEQEVYNTILTLPSTEGIVSISLPATGTLAPLKIGKKYRWSFSIIADPDNRAEDIYVDGWVQRVELSPSLLTELKKAIPSDRPALYAQATIWHETLITLAELRRANPTDATLTRQWEDLLRSVGLNRIADKPLLEIPLANERQVQPSGTRGNRLEDGGAREPDIRQQSRPSPGPTQPLGGLGSPDVRPAARGQGGAR